jgi:hypothetical protein
VTLILYFLNDLGSYGPLWWIAFVGIAFTAARLGRWWGVFASQMIVGLLILGIDVAWISEQMLAPGYQVGQGPDMDAAFAFGVMARVVLANILLLPVSIAGILLPRRTRRINPSMR